MMSGLTEAEQGGKWYTSNQIGREENVRLQDMQRLSAFIDVMRGHMDV